MIELSIRQRDKSDLKKMDYTFNSEYGRAHAHDLHDQSLSYASFFVAWLQDKPVGHALVRWLGPREEIVMKDYPDCPEIFRLKVLEGFRSQGIATAIIKKCENEALKRKYLIIGLGTYLNVNSKNNLYIRLGYVRSTVSSYIDSYESKLEDGTVAIIRKEAKFLIKRIGTC